MPRQRRFRTRVRRFFGRRRRRAASVVAPRRRTSRASVGIIGLLGAIAMINTLIPDLLRSIVDTVRFTLAGDKQQAKEHGAEIGTDITKGLQQMADNPFSVGVKAVGVIGAVGLAAWITSLLPRRSFKGLGVRWKVA